MVFTLIYSLELLQNVKCQVCGMWLKVAIVPSCTKAHLCGNLALSLTASSHNYKPHIFLSCYLSVPV